MAVEALQSSGLAHAVFLSRIGDELPTVSEVRLAQGAFLAMRLVDLLAPGQRVQPDVFNYQWRATERYCAALSSEGPEGAHLREIVRSVGEAYRTGTKQLLVPALFAYVYHLERELRLEEALDVVETLVRVLGPELAVNEAVAAQLRLGVLNRNLARFSAAEIAYQTAEKLAQASGDTHSVLLSRLGRANALRQRGELKEAENTLRAILADAEATADIDARARGEHLLGIVLELRGQLDLAAVHEWRAYTLYDDNHARARVLGDLGITLRRLGDISSAVRCLQEVVRTGGQQDVVLNAKIELMHCASSLGDRIGFERWSSECEVLLHNMTPGMLADFRLKGGIGYARFGQFRRAEQLLEQAHRVAAEHRLHELEFRIERIKAGLGDCEEVAREDLHATAEPVLQSEELREVSAALALLGA